ncbi:MAG TPA: polysaccharide biosynthesis tyrosine autokinase [Pyrinomonadaceae bacterium]
MEQDQRLTPLPKTLDLRVQKNDYPSTYPAFYDDEVSEGRRSLQQYFNVIKKRIPIILALTTLATAAAAFYMYRIPSQYQATTEMVIEPRKPKVQSKDSININFGNDANYYNTQLELLQNTDLMKEVVIRLGLYKDPDLFGNENRGVLSGLRAMFSSGKDDSASENALPVVSDVSPGSEGAQNIQLTSEEKARAESYAAILAGRMSVQPRERTNIVNVSVTTPNPQLSARVADMVADVFIEKDGERETEGARRTYEDLTRSIEELRKTITEQEADLISYMRSSGLPLQEKGQELSASRLQSMSETWLKAMEGRRQLEARYNAALQASSRGEGMNIPDLYENKIFQDTMRLNTERKAKLQDQIRDIDKKIQEADAEKAELLVKYTPEYSKVKEVEERISSLNATKEKTEREVSSIIERDQKKIEKDAVGGALVALRSQLAAAQKQEAQALAAYEQEAAQANVQGQAQTELTTKKRAIETNRNLLDTYTQRQKEQELAIASGRPDNIKIAANAVTPGGPIGPQRTRNIFVAFLVSLAVGIGLAFLLDYLDDSIKTSDDIGRHLGLPTLALIPHHFGSEKRRLKLAAANGNGNGSSFPASTGLITLEERRSPMAEAYRHLRTSLLFSSAGKPPQSILVTSSQPSEGKTTTAINTAVTLAQADADVVIVDCDLRRPRLHSYFDLENSQGLTNYLSGERNTEHLIKNCRDLPRLKVITSGPIPPNPAELLSSNEMKNLLQFLRGRYKHVIIDSPPAISFTDAAILSTLVDGVVIVAMAGKSSIHLMRRFKHRLGNIGARIYGVVLNGIKAGSMEYDYYGTGYYEYYANSDADDSTPVMEEVGTIHRTKP